MNKITDFLIDKGLKKKKELIESFAADNIVTTPPKINVKQKTVHVGQDLYSDIEFFQNYTSSKDGDLSVFECFENILIGSKELGRQVFSNPLNDLDVLKQRSELVDKLNIDPVDLQLFETLKKYESNVLWLFQEHEKHIQDLMNIVYFRLPLLKPLNKIPMALTVNNIYRIIGSPLIGILSPIMYFIVPYLIVRIKFKIDIPFTSYLKFIMTSLLSCKGPVNIVCGGGMKYVYYASYAFSLLFYFQGLFNSVEIAKTINKICKVIINRFNGAVEYLQTAIKLLEKYYDPQMFRALAAANENLVDIDATYIKLLGIQPFTLFTNFGKQLMEAKHIKKDMVNTILIQSYVLDFFKGLVVFKKKHSVKQVSFVDDSKIVFEIKGLHHPCLENSVVKNDLIYDKNVIITGPNAGGKSTCIKSILINVVLMQTVGLCSADSCRMTLFKNIVSQINIPDCKGSESLFEAEMHRCHKNLELLRDSDEFTLIVMDEIFNSTNPVEGIAGAYAIAKKIGDYSKCFLIFTTHYIYLTKLERDTGRFMNYKMNVIQEEKIKFPYTLERGRSKQCIALELLKQNGFDPEIVDEAIKIKNRLKC